MVACKASLADCSGVDTGTTSLVPILVEVSWSGEAWVRVEEAR